MKEWVTFVAAVFAAVGLEASEPLAWPRFRGPGGSGIADDQRPPVEFGPDKNVRWKVSVPSGMSSPIIAGDTIVITAFDREKLYTIAYNRVDGQEAWRKVAQAEQIEKYLPGEGSPAASTPVTDGERVVSYFGSCGLICYDLTGRELWKYEMPPVDLPGNFGSGVSPILVDGTVVLVRDEARNARILALDANTGKLKWKTNRESLVSYCTPIVMDTGDSKQVVAAGHVRMVAYDLNSGAERWSVMGLPSGCCTSPVAADGVVYYLFWHRGDRPQPACDATRFLLANSCSTVEMK